MKIIKPGCLSLLTRPYEFRRQFGLGIAVIAFLPVGDEPSLLPEPAMWPFLAEELPPDHALDAAIPKVQAEFLAMAHAFAPDGMPSAQVTTGIRLGETVKTLDVFPDRRRDRNGALVEDPTPFTAMKLDWSRAYGGPDIAGNPLGLGSVPLPGAAEAVFPVPNILNIKLGRAALTTPVGYGPVDQTWPLRAKMAGTYGDLWLKEDFPGFPRDIDWRYFNLASSDQWLKDGLNGDEEYAFKNLHPMRPLLRGRLPGLAPRVFLVRKTIAASFEEIVLSLTTVWFFPHRERILLIWHGTGTIAEEDGSDVARVVLGADRMNALRPAADFHAVMVQRADTANGALYALRDEQLVPAEWIRRDPALALPDLETSPLGQILNRQRRKAERERQKIISDLEVQGLDPARYVPPLPPPPKMPTLEELPEFVAALQKEAEAEKAKAEAVIAEQKAEATRQLVAAGLTEKEVQKKLGAKAGGPPAFSAAATLADMARQVTAMRVLGQLTFELEEKLTSPVLAAQFAHAEAAIRDGYRMGAHHQGPANAATPEQSAKIRASLAGDSAAARALYDLHGADLSGMDLSGVDLSGVCLDGAILTGIRFAGAKLVNAVLAHADMTGCILDGADLSGASLGKARLAGASLRGANMKKAVLAGADLTDACLSGADLEDADLMETIVVNADFSNVHAPGILMLKLSLAGFFAPGTNFDKAKFIECDLSKAYFAGASLHRAAFVETCLDGADLEGARLEKAVFVKQSKLDGARLRGADLTGVNLREISMIRADLDGAIATGADFSGADMRGVYMPRVMADNARFVATNLNGANLHGGSYARADFSRADLRGADLSGISVYEANLPRVKLDPNTRRAGMFRTRMRYLPLYEAPEGNPS